MRESIGRILYTHLSVKGIHHSIAMENHAVITIIHAQVMESVQELILAAAIDAGWEHSVTL
jgi:hypothetical protein